MATKTVLRAWCGLSTDIGNPSEYKLYFDSIKAARESIAIDRRFRRSRKEIYGSAYFYELTNLKTKELIPTS